MTLDDELCSHQISVDEWRAESLFSCKAEDWLLQESWEKKASNQEDWLPLRRNLIHISQSIERSQYLLELTDEDYQPACAKATWDRAVQFLSACARRAWEITGKKIETPDFLLGPDKSIDLHWKRPSYEMLINIPSDPNEVPSYYGDDSEGNSTKGTIVSGNNQGLILWLTTHK